MVQKWIPRGGPTKLAQKMGFFSKIAKNGYFMGLCSKTGAKEGVSVRYTEKSPKMAPEGYQKR